MVRAGLLGFDVSNTHHALSDVLPTAQVYDYLVALPKPPAGKRLTTKSTKEAGRTKATKRETAK